MWGQEGDMIFQRIQQGIIPMRVGTSIGINITTEAVRDHPHACGDKLLILASMLRS